MKLIQRLQVPPGESASFGKYQRKRLADALAMILNAIVTRNVGLVVQAILPESNSSILPRGGRLPQVRSRDGIKKLPWQLMIFGPCYELIGRQRGRRFSPSERSEE